LKIKVLYFSSLKDRLKKSSEEIDINKPMSVKQFLKLLKEKHPEVSQSLDSVMVAVNEEYVDTNYTLKDGDVLAFIPPVSGG